MTEAAPAVNRRDVLYAVALNLIAIGVAMLLSPGNGAVIAPFIVAAAAAALRGGWKVGFVTTALSLAALLFIFNDSVRLPHLLLFLGAAIAASIIQVATPAEAEIVEHAAAGKPIDVPALAMRFGLPAFVLILYLNVSHVLVDNLGLPSILQPLILVLAGLVVGYSSAFRPGKALGRPVAMALFAYCLYVFASTNWARDVATADFELTDLVKSVMILFVAAGLAATWKSLRAAMVTLVAGAALLSILTIAQVAIGRTDFTFGGLAEVEVGQIFGEVVQPRPSGPVGDPNYFARILILALPAATVLGIGRTRRSEQIAYLAATAAICVAILLTYSRGGMLAAAVVAMLLVFVKRLRITWKTALAGIALLVILIPTPVGRRVLTIQSVVGDQVEDASVDKRRQLLEVGLRMFDDRPLFGVGVGNFGFHYPAYSNLVGLSGPEYMPLGVRQYPHNLYLEMATETGAVGLLLFLGAMAIILLTLDRARRALIARGEEGHAALVTSVGIALTGYLVASLFLHQSGFSRYLWLILGLAVAACRVADESLEASPLA